MTDPQALYLTLLGLYLIECLTWVQRGSAAFIGCSPERAILAFPPRLLSNDKGGAVLGFPFLSGAHTFVVPQWPASLGPEGVVGWVAESLELEARAHQTGIFRRFEDFERARSEDREVLLDREALLSTSSAARAHEVAQAIQRLRELPREERALAIEALVDRQMDQGAIRGRLARYHRETAGLRAASRALTLVVFLGAPALVMRLGFERTWWLLLAVIYALTWLSAALCFRAHLALYPEARLQRWGYLVLEGLLPISAMRASDRLARPLLQGFHPLAVAAVLVDPRRLAGFAAHLVRDARQPRRPVCLNEHDDAQAAEAFYRGVQKAKLEELVRQAGLDPAAMAAPPSPDEPELALYCPRCTAGYGAGAEVCEDCGGIPLSQLEGARPGEEG